MSCVNLLHEEIAGGAAARSRFLAAGGSGGGSVFAKDTSGTTVEAPAPEPEPRSDLQPMCTSLYYVDHDGACHYCGHIKPPLSPLTLQSAAIWLACLSTW